MKLNTDQIERFTSNLRRVASSPGRDHKIALAAMAKAAADLRSQLTVDIQRTESGFKLRRRHGSSNRDEVLLEGTLRRCVRWLTSFFNGTAIDVDELMQLADELEFLTSPHGRQDYTVGVREGMKQLELNMRENSIAWLRAGTFETTENQGASGGSASRRSMNTWTPKSVRNEGATLRD